MVSLLNIQVVSTCQGKTFKFVTFSVEYCKYLLGNYNVLATAMDSENIKEMIFALHYVKKKYFESARGTFPELHL